MWFRHQILTPPGERSALTRYGVTVLSLVASIYLREAFARWLEPGGSFAFFLPAAAVAAWFAGARLGLLVTLVGGLLGFLSFGDPLNGRDATELLRLLLFLANGVIVTGLCAALHHAFETSRTASDEASRHFEIMANNAPVLIWSSDVDGRCVFVNRNWLAFTGRSTTHKPGGIRPGQLHPADLGRYQAISTEATAARKTYQVEYRLRRADGTYRWLLEHAVPRFSRDERFEGYIGSCNDVTDSRHEREELAFIARLQTALTESLDLDKCADSLVQSFVPRFADWCCIELVNEQGTLERVRLQHLDRGAGPLSPIRVAGTETQAARIARTGEAQLLRRADESLLQTLAYDEAHFQRLRSVGAVSYLGVPLRARGNIIGVLSLATAESGRTLGAEEFRLLQKVAGIAGFALDNARLYRSARQALAAEEHARLELERSERRFRFIWDANVLGLCTIDRTGRILTANRALGDLLHYSPEEIARGSATVQERTPAAWHAADERATTELRQTGRCAPFEKEFLRPDGSTVQVLVCGALLPDSDECVAFVLDLTARKHAERALERQRTLLKTIIDAMPAMVAYVGPDERFWLHNEKYQKWLGVGSDAIQGRTMQQLVGDEAYERMAPYLQAALRGRNMRHETTLRSASRERHLIASYRPDRDAEGQVCGVVIHAYDITERKETEQALAEALLRYRFLADAMPQMVWTAVPGGQLDYVNHRWLETTGLTEVASLGRENWLEAVHVEDRATTREHWKRAIDQCTPFEHECRLRCGRQASWRWHLVRALPRRDDQGVLVQWVGSATDIDEQRRAYAELAEARERLRSHADLLEERVRARTATLREANAELEAFTYSVSHDLRTPLQFVRGFAEAIRSDAGNTLSEENRDYLQRIIRAATRMDTIIQDLLGYSRLARSDMQLVELSLDDVIADVLTHHHAAIKQSGAQVIVERPLPHVCADKTGLFQALSNLVSNALKFTRPGERARVRVHAEQIGASARLWVEDQGIGIDARHHDRIFQLFERLHSPTDYPGTGIGLSLVKKAVSRMGGRCGLESAPNQGSRFWIDFPDACAVKDRMRHAAGASVHPFAAAR